MPGITAKTLTGYNETEYASEWPGLVTNAPTSRIPAGAVSSCQAMVVRGRLQPQPAVFPLSSFGIPVNPPPLAINENICKFAQLQPPGQQGGFTVVITNKAVYIDFQASGGYTKTFIKVFAFPTPYPRYAHFDSCVIGNKLYFSSASQRGVWCLTPLYQLTSSNFETEITNPGNDYTSAPTVYMSGGGGTPLSGTATIANGQLQSISWSGTGIFTSAPSVTLVGGLGSGSSGSSTNYSPSSGTFANISVSASSPTWVQVITGLIDGWPSEVLSADALTISVTFNATASSASGGVYVEFQLSPDNGTTWYTFNAVGISSNSMTWASQTVTFALPFNVPNIDTIQFRLVGNAIAAPSTTVSMSLTVTNIYITSTTPGAPPYQGSAAIILNFPFGYTVIEVSAPSGVQSVQITAAGSGYLKPIVLFSGGQGSGASGTVILNAAGNVVGVAMDTLGTWYSSPPTVQIIETESGGGSGATAVAVLQLGKPFIGGDFMSTMSQRLLLGNIIGGDGNTTSGIYEVLVVAPGTGYTAPIVDIVGGGGQGAAAHAVLSGSTIGSIVVDSFGEGYTSTPQVNILDTTGTGAMGLAILTPPLLASTDTPHPDYVAWSGPNAPAYFDPNYGLAPGGYDQLTEARGLIASLNVVESVAFVGHNGGITEMTPNTTAALLAFSFYPLWSADEGVLVRYGSMAQYGSTLAFLANDSGYTMTPNGLTEIGQNIANLLQNAQVWNDGNYPLQGLYGSIVLIEGQKHYLIVLSNGDPNFDFSTTRETAVYDYNMSENSWHYWEWSDFSGSAVYQTATCPIYQAFDQSPYTPAGAPSGQVLLDRQSWLLLGWTGTRAAFEEQANVYQITPFNLQIELLGFESPPTAIAQSVLKYQFRNEAPSIARMQQERRIAVEYENQIVLGDESITPTPVFTYSGQQDPTVVTGTVIQPASLINAALPQLGASSGIVPGQVLTAQIDFGTFTAACSNLKLAGSGNGALVSIVRITQASTLPKAELT